MLTKIKDDSRGFSKYITDLLYSKPTNVVEFQFGELRYSASSDGTNKVKVFVSENNEKPKLMLTLELLSDKSIQFTLFSGEKWTLQLNVKELIKYLNNELFSLMIPDSRISDSIKNPFADDKTLSLYHKFQEKYKDAHSASETFSSFWHSLLEWCTFNLKNPSTGKFSGNRRVFCLPLKSNMTLFIHFPSSTKYITQFITLPDDLVVQRFNITPEAWMAPLTISEISNSVVI